jgi:hypothetical protein
MNSTSKGATRQASAFADAKDAFLVGAGRPPAEGLPRPNSFGTRRTPGVGLFTPIEIGLHGRSAPGVGLRRRRRHFFRSAQADRWPKASGGRIHSARRPTIGRRPLEAEFIRRPRPTAGQRRPRRLKSASQGAPRQAPASANAKPLPGRRRLSRRLKSAFWGAYAPSVGLRRRRRHFFRSAQADRWPKASGGRIHSARRPTIGRRPLEAEFIRRPRPTVGQRRPRRLKSASQGAPRQASASADAKPLLGRRRLSRRLKSAFWGAYAPSVGLRRRRRHFFGRRRPTVGRRPLEAEFIRRAGRPLAEGLWRPNSFGVPGRPSAKGAHAD